MIFQCNEIVKSRFRLVISQLKNWKKYSVKSMHVLHRVVSKLKLRMTKTKFDTRISKLERTERELVASKMRGQFASRIKGMAKKESHRKKEDSGRFKGILISDSELKEKAQDLNMERVLNYMVMGDIELSDVEKEFLNIHYKCRERERISKFDLEVELTKLSTKHRYEKMLHGDDLEKETD